LPKWNNSQKHSHPETNKEDTVSDIATQIADLSPEQRDLLLRKLRLRQNGLQEQGTADPNTQSTSRPFDLERDQNFTLKIPRTGILENFVYRASRRVAPGPGQVEIEVYASSLNFRDVLIALGEYPSSSAEMGSDCSGKVVRVGEDVVEFKVGDEVIAISEASAFSRFTTTMATDVVRKPASLNFEEGASIPTVFVTLYHSLHNLAVLSKGERIVIHSAAGGIGLAAIQYAQAVGAEIFATVGSDEKRAYLRSIGIERIFNSRSLDFAEEIMKATNGEGVDVVLNSLGGEAIPKGLSILRPLGRFVELGRRDFAQNSQIGLAPFDNSLTFFAVSLYKLSVLRPAFYNSVFREIVDKFDRGIFKPLKMTEYAASEITSAFQQMAVGNHIGKHTIRFKDQEIMVAALPAA
jgi:polyketide synthase 12/myxalamid-type polyketide synthase MxaB/epothilone polyketide synthase D